VFKNICHPALYSVGKSRDITLLVPVYTFSESLFHPCVRWRIGARVVLGVVVQLAQASPDESVFDSVLRTKIAEMHPGTHIR
jgi:hypothetical protein